jgi:hypothetical protein
VPTFAEHSHLVPAFPMANAISDVQGLASRIRAHWLRLFWLNGAAVQNSERRLRGHFTLRCADLFGCSLKAASQNLVQR